MKETHFEHFHRVFWIILGNSLKKISRFFNIFEQKYNEPFLDKIKFCYASEFMRRMHF